MPQTQTATRAAVRDTWPVERFETPKQCVGYRVRNPLGRKTGRLKRLFLNENGGAEYALLYARGRRRRYVRRASRPPRRRPATERQSFAYRPLRVRMGHCVGELDLHPPGLAPGGHVRKLTPQDLLPKTEQESTLEYHEGLRTSPGRGERKGYGVRLPPASLATLGATPSTSRANAVGELPGRGRRRCRR
jgi:hypothetical protein